MHIELRLKIAVFSNNVIIYGLVTQFVHKYNMFMFPQPESSNPILTTNFSIEKEHLLACFKFNKN